MKPVHAKRLLKLADFLDALPRKRFDYNSWVGFDWKGKPDLSCGTTACALGWATTIPAFRRLGAALRPMFDSSDVGTVVLVRDGDRIGGAYDVGVTLFGLDVYGFGYLFTGKIGPNGEPSLDVDATPKQTARHIRKFVAAAKQVDR